jgi:hypothetical protein
MGSTPPINRLHLAGLDNGTRVSFVTRASTAGKQKYTNYTDTSTPPFRYGVMKDEPKCAIAEAGHPVVIVSVDDLR